MHFSRASELDFGLHNVDPPKRRFGLGTLIGSNKDEMWSFEALFNGVSTRFGPRTIEKSIENQHFLFCSVPCSEQEKSQFRTHDLTKEVAYVSAQQSGQFDTFLFNHFSVYCNLA